MSEPCRKIVRYSTVAATTLEQFDDLAQDALNRGWQPYGNPISKQNPGQSDVLVQVFVLYEPMTIQVALEKFRHTAPVKLQEIWKSL